MITSYHRPESLAEALSLLSRTTPRTLPLGGGTSLARTSVADIEVVDLQSLGLNAIRRAGDELAIGATATLQQLLEHADCPSALRVAVGLEATLNLRNAGTVAGTLMVATGRSSFATALLALDARVTIIAGRRAEGTGRKKSTMKARGPSDAGLEGTAMALADLMTRRAEMNGSLITQVSVPLQARIVFEHVSKTPADSPLVSVAMAQWASGRTRAAVGGFGKLPALAMDGTESAGAEVAVRNAAAESDDEWASAEYRMHAAGVLAARCVHALGASA